MTQIQQATRESIVSVKDISMIYRTRGPGGETLETVALKDANLEIQPGEFISLIGPSGCGKTTLLRLLADLIQPSSGTLAIALWSAPSTGQDVPV